MTDAVPPEPRPEVGDGDRSWLGNDRSWLGDDEPRGDEAAGGSPAVFLLIAAAGLVVSACALAGGVGFGVLGYLCASLLLFTAVAWFRRGSVERAARDGIATSRSLNVAAVALLISGFALSLVHAWRIAIYFS